MNSKQRRKTQTFPLYKKNTLKKICYINSQRLHKDGVVKKV